MLSAVTELCARCFSKEEEIGKAAPRRLPWWKDEYLLNEWEWGWVWEEKPKNMYENKKRQSKISGIKKNKTNNL